MESAGNSDDDYARRLADVTIGEPERLRGAIELREYDPAWPEAFRREAARIAGALGPRALLIEHVGSTSVPGLVAKPIIDIVLEVVDSTDEDAYVPGLESAQMLAFRDRLRTDAAARERYAARKHELAARDWTYMQQYADAKTDVIRSILAG